MNQAAAANFEQFDTGLYNLAPEFIDEQIEKIQQTENQAGKPQNFWDKYADAVAAKTITPHLRTQFDRRFAQGIVKSSTTFFSGAVISILGPELLSSATELSNLTSHLIAGTIGMGLISFGSPDDSYYLHQHAHVPLTNSKSLNTFLDYYLSVKSGFTAWHWRIQHVLGHHGHGQHPQFGELDQEHCNVDRRQKGAYWKLLLEHDFPNSAKVLIEPVVHIIRERVAGKVGVESHLEAEKLEATKQALREAGADEETLQNLVFDEKIQVHYLKSLLNIASVWVVIGFLISQNLLLIFGYAFVQFLTKCTDVINHTYPDGSGYSPGMINLAKKLAQNVPGFAWHRLHHDYPFLHPQYYGQLLAHLWKKGEVPAKEFEVCEVQPGTGGRGIYKDIFTGMVQAGLRKIKILAR